jgi:hypothetical protein
MKLKVVADSVKDIPFLADTGPESIVKFFIAAKKVYDLKLVTDFELISLLVGRTSGRVAQILGTHLNTNSDWGMVRSEVIDYFLPPRVKERFLAVYVLDRFQSSSENLNDYIIAVVAAADVLGFEGPESRLVHRMVQNLHPQVKAHLMFCTKPESVQDLFALATTVAKAMAVEEQRKSQPSTARREGAALRG